MHDDLDALCSERGQLFSKLKPAEKFYTYWEVAGLRESGIIHEYQFCDRKWRFDFAWPQCMLAVEVHGFGWGHQAQQHMAGGFEKTREAIRLGWTVLTFTSRCLGSKDKALAAVELVNEILVKKYPEIQPDDDGCCVVCGEPSLFGSVHRECWPKYKDG